MEETDAKKRRIDSETSTIVQVLDPSAFTSRFEVKQSNQDLARLYIVDTRYNKRYEVLISEAPIVSLVEYPPALAVPHTTYTFRIVDGRIQLLRLSEQMLDQFRQYPLSLDVNYFAVPEKVCAIRLQQSSQVTFRSKLDVKLWELSDELRHDDKCAGLILRFDRWYDLPGHVVKQGVTSFRPRPEYMLCLYHKDNCISSASIDISATTSKLYIQNFATFDSYAANAPVYEALLTLVAALVVRYVRVNGLPVHKVTAMFYNPKTSSLSLTQLRTQLDFNDVEYSETGNLITIDHCTSADVQSKLHAAFLLCSHHHAILCPDAAANDYSARKLREDTVLMPPLELRVTLHSSISPSAVQRVPNVQDVRSVAEFERMFAVYKYPQAQKIIIYMKQERHWVTLESYEGALITIITSPPAGGSLAVTYLTYSFVVRATGSEPAQVEIIALPDAYTSASSLFWNRATDDAGYKLAEIDCTQAELDKAVRILPSAYDLVDTLNRTLTARCPNLKLRFGGNFEMTGHVTQFDRALEKRPLNHYMLCLYSGEDCVSSITFSLNNQYLEISSRTIPAYEKRAYNTLLRGIVVLISDHVSPAGKPTMVVSQIANAISAYLLVKKLGARLVSRRGVGDWLTTTGVTTFGPCVKPCVVFVEYPEKLPAMTASIEAASSFTDVQANLTKEINDAYNLGLRDPGDDNGSKYWIHAMVAVTPQNITRARTLVDEVLARIDCFPADQAQQQVQQYGRETPQSTTTFLAGGYAVRAAFFGMGRLNK